MYIYNGELLEWDDKDTCPICGDKIELYVKSTCAKQRYLMCPTCTFSSKLVTIATKKEIETLPKY